MQRERGLCLKAVSCGWHEVCSIAMAAVARADCPACPVVNEHSGLAVHVSKESCGRAEYF